MSQPAVLIPTGAHQARRPLRRNDANPNSIDEVTPGLDRKRQTTVPHNGRLTEHRRLRKLLAKRSRIEAVIGDLKAEHRLCRNYLHGTVSDELNVLLAAVGWNLKKLLRFLWLMPEGLMVIFEMALGLGARLFTLPEACA
jgi:Transposase DDE domain